MQVAIIDDYQGLAKKRSNWSELSKDVQITFFEDHLFDEDEISKRLQDFEVICAMRERTPFQQSQLEKLKNLRLLITSGMRNLSIDLTAAEQLGIKVCGTPAFGRPTAELAWGLILGLARKIPMEDQNIRNGVWQKSIGVGLKDKTLGIAGLGNLGSKMAAIAHAFEMKTIAWSQNLTIDRCNLHRVERVSKTDLMQRSDFLSIHLVLSERTRGIFGAPELADMKESAFLINTSRSPIIDETSLIDALKNNKIAGAGIDVFNIEPLPKNHTLTKLKNVILTPHLGYVEEENYNAYFSGYVSAIKGFLDGNLVNVLRR